MASLTSTAVTLSLIIAMFSGPFTPRRGPLNLVTELKVERIQSFCVWYTVTRLPRRGR